jgi:hypothetical protein
MTFISVTRFRLRSPLYLPLVGWHSYRSSRQLTKQAGFLGGRLLADANLAFWTITAWQGADRMRHYRDSGAHQRAMPLLSLMCSEASVAHWQQEDETLPDWQTAHERMSSGARFYKLSAPSENHVDKVIPQPKLSDPFAGQIILPKHKQQVPVEVDGLV